MHWVSAYHTLSQIPLLARVANTIVHEAKVRASDGVFIVGKFTFCFLRLIGVVSFPSYSRMGDNGGSGSGCDGHRCGFVGSLECGDNSCIPVVTQGTSSILREKLQSLDHCY